MNTVRQALEHARKELEGFDEAALEAEVLLGHALNKNRSWLHTWPDKPLAENLLSHFQQMIAERKQGKPIAYITGSRDFWNITLQVTPATLIPRADTETLIEAALSLIPQNTNWRIADLGTGSGAIALVLAGERPNCEIVASDISADALAVAINNCKHLELDNVMFIQSTWLEQLEGKFDLIASNPPYIAENDPHLQQGDLPFEPATALGSGNNGLADIETIIDQARQHLHTNGWLILEHGWNQQHDLALLLKKYGYHNVICKQDLAGHDRVSLAQYHANAN